MNKEKRLKISHLREGNIIFVSQIFNRTFENIKNKTKESGYVNFTFPKDYKGRAFLVCINNSKEGLIYGFEMRSKKHKTSKNFVLKNKDGERKYILSNRLQVYYYESVLTTNIINKYFELTNSEFKDLSKKLLNDFINKNFLKKNKK